MKPIQLAVVGLNFGSWMIEHELLATSTLPFVQIVAVCDLQVDLAKQWGEKLQVPYDTDLSVVLKRREVEAVALFTGPIDRAYLIQQIIQAGKHVMTTKPFEAQAGKAKHVLALARSLGKVVHLNSPSPELSPDLQKVQQWINEYDLGQPLAFRAETTCSYREQVDGSWYDSLELCPIAPITRLGIYLINDMIRFFGDVAEVQVQQSRLFTQRPTVDHAQLSLRFENGALGHIFASFCIDDQQYYKAAFTMNFERGTIYRNIFPMVQTQEHKQNELFLIATRQGKMYTDRFLTPIQQGYQWQVFYEVIRGLRTDSEEVHSHIVAGIRLLEMMKQVSLSSSKRG
jgi:predicted dehydrogenase